MFTQGNVIILRSNSCGKSLRIRQGEVEGVGGQGPHGKHAKVGNGIWVTGSQERYCADS